MDTNDTKRGRGRAAGFVAAGLVGGVVLAGFASASAQTDPTPSPSQSDGTTSTAPLAKGGRGPGGHHGKGMGAGIHGEFVTANPNGGYQTMATQRGEVTAVSATSLTVKSEDGYSRTYVVNDDTMVGAGDEGIADVKVGDDVHVLAIVADGKASAVNVHDATQGARIRGRYAPRPPETAPSASTSGASA